MAGQCVTRCFKRIDVVENVVRVENPQRGGLIDTRRVAGIANVVTHISSSSLEVQALWSVMLTNSLLSLGNSGRRFARVIRSDQPETR